jgi:hypothetical protein
MTTRVTPDLINGNLALRNRLVNGSMQINQRGNTSFSIPSATGTYICDNWIAASVLSSGAITIANNSSVPGGTGLPNSIICTTSATRTVAAAEYAVIQTGIEGYRMIDFLFGNAAAKTIAISFWVNASATGTYGGSIMNAGTSRSYPFSYSVNSSSTWEQKTIVIPGDITGTWNNAANLGMRINFLLAGGSSMVGTANTWIANNLYGATGSASILTSFARNISFAGVQIEIGQAASAFDFRGYAQDLADCQRYYYRQQATTTSQPFYVPINAIGAASANAPIRFPVPMRVAPTALEQSGTAGNYGVIFLGSITTCSSVPTFGTATIFGATTVLTVTSGLTGGQAGQLVSSAASGSNAYLGWSAEML